MGASELFIPSTLVPGQRAIEKRLGISEARVSEATGAGLSRKLWGR